ncbi:hypothetical protein NC99_45330 [Sunxiuqinia dokdonensis]|uniref:Uncharacterized protein n=1 Tax=Sunxiuqinia dokdonensis TaxID=1409788 RepID=A0A0L8V2E2_9BACT|nr:hypothetical protein NC99_45330 [Sunxiuqinia dokdonensis]
MFSNFLFAVSFNHLLTSDLIKKSQSTVPVTRNTTEVTSFTFSVFYVSIVIFIEFKLVKRICFTNLFLKPHSHIGHIDVCFRSAYFFIVFIHLQLFKELI